MDVPARLDGTPPVLSQHEHALSGLRKVIESLVGRAESADGLVRAEWTEAEGLHSLYIAPEAMTQDVHALEKQIKDVALMAVEDLEAQTRKLIEAALSGDGAVPEIAALRNRPEREDRDGTS